MNTAVKRAAARTTTAAACAALLLTGCGSDEEASPSEGPTVIQMPVSDNRLMVAGTPDEIGQERLEGKPTFLYGCLGAQAGTDEGMKNHLVVWPDGTTVAGADDDALRIGDDVIEPGASFVARGVTVDGQPFPAEFPEIPIPCLGANTEKIWWVQEIVEINE